MAKNYVSLKENGVVLTPEQESFMCTIINHLGSGQHPWAGKKEDHEHPAIEFTHYYCHQLVMKAINGKTKKGDSLVTEKGLVMAKTILTILNLIQQ